jgi:hypothetical protein
VQILWFAVFAVVAEIAGQKKGFSPLTTETDAFCDSIDLNPFK